MSKLETHLHTYERSSMNRKVFRCISPDCTHFTRREHLLGKYALCFKCRQQFTLDKKQLDNKHPVCIMCSKSPKKIIASAAKDVMLDLLNELNDHENGDGI